MFGLREKIKLEYKMKLEIWKGHENHAEEVTCIDEGNGPTSFEGVERKEPHKKEKRLVFKYF